ncbi:transglutaminase-like domain-containing protein [Anaerolentibacter hominis]|uniref:transglutaminase-like domain-containing protein n=1 Tax=Anaerolentibacter hominis TaxID=3079009 RepID=UPI0031B80CAD
MSCFKKKITICPILILCCLLLCSCSSDEGTPPPDKNANPDSAGTVPVRSSEPVVLVPSADAAETLGNKSVTIDASHTQEGYIMAQYTGNNKKVKLQLTTPAGITYTYLLHSSFETFPLTGEDGTYKIKVYENVKGDEYAQLYAGSLDVSITNVLGPYLYPNQYVNFDKDTRAVSVGAELASGAVADLEVVSAVYNYIVENIVYDDAKASDVRSDYLPVVDDILESKTGICFDYAALMATMLRTQRIPTRLEVGYAGEIYHAWISIYIKDIGWINGIIQFDGKSWKLMDPTFAASNHSSDKVMEFIGNTDNYVTKYVY